MLKNWMFGFVKTYQKINWQSYAETFPSKYVNHTKSDESVEKTINMLPNGSALDVGGGVSGTEYLKEWAVDYYLLDPYVRSSERQVSWLEVKNRKFDIILARGSFNYLSITEITTLLECIGERGAFFFNTFLTPKTGSRRYSSVSGQGIESFKFVSGKPFGKIIHTLAPDDSDVLIRHEFYYYPTEFLESIFKEHKIKWSLTKTNNTGLYMCRHLRSVNSST